MLMYLGALIWLIAALSVMIAIRSTHMVDVRKYLRRMPYYEARMLSFDQMVFNPRYWHLWTERQWRMYIERQWANKS